MRPTHPSFPAPQEARENTPCLAVDDWAGEAGPEPPAPLLLGQSHQQYEGCNRGYSGQATKDGPKGGRTASDPQNLPGKDSRGTWSLPKTQNPKAPSPHWSVFVAIFTISADEKCKVTELTGASQRPTACSLPPLPSPAPISQMGHLRPKPQYAAEQLLATASQTGPRVVGLR